MYKENKSCVVDELEQTENDYVISVARFATYFYKNLKIDSNQ